MHRVQRVHRVHRVHRVQRMALKIRFVFDGKRDKMTSKRKLDKELRLLTAVDGDALMRVAMGTDSTNPSAPTRPPFRYTRTERFIDSTLGFLLATITAGATLGLLYLVAIVARLGWEAGA